MIHHMILSMSGRGRGSEHNSPTLIHQIGYECIKNTQNSTLLLLSVWLNFCAIRKKSNTTEIRMSWNVRLNDNTNYEHREFLQIRAKESSRTLWEDFLIRQNGAFWGILLCHFCELKHPCKKLIIQVLKTARRKRDDEWGGRGRGVVESSPAIFSG